ncbi:MAG: MotA/TolQ/ExbB proton channel family protein [Cyanobacteria bacterium P01_E01_bin.34]
MGQIVDIFNAGGVVMYPLVLFSVISIALMLERWAFWWKLRQRQPRLVREVMNLYRRNPRAALFKLEQNADLPIARIFLAGVEIDRANPDEFRLAIEAAVAAEMPLLKRFTTVFDTIITLSPFLGLLGTVLGLMGILSSIDLGDIGGTSTIGVGEGIAEALTSTASGLVVAILTLLISNIFRSLYVREMAQIQDFGGQLELQHRRRYELGFPEDPLPQQSAPYPQQPQPLA